MGNLTAKQLEEKIGFKKNTSIFIGEFMFLIYVDQDINSRYGEGRLYILVHNNSDLFDALNLQKQYTTTDNVEKDIRKQLNQLQKKIARALKQTDQRGV